MSQLQPHSKPATGTNSSVLEEETAELVLLALELGTGVTGGLLLEELFRGTLVELAVGAELDLTGLEVELGFADEDFSLAGVEEAGLLEAGVELDLAGEEEAALLEAGAELDLAGLEEAAELGTTELDGAAEDPGDVVTSGTIEDGPGALLEGRAIEVELATMGSMELEAQGTMYVVR